MLGQIGHPLIHSICVKLLHTGKHDKLTQCCRAFILALARLSCSQKERSDEEPQRQSYKEGRESMTEKIVKRAYIGINSDWRESICEMAQPPICLRLVSSGNKSSSSSSLFSHNKRTRKSNYMNI